MELPPAQVTRAVIQRYARLLGRYDADLGTRPLVLPNAAFFPDAFEGDQDSVSLLVERMQEHAGLADVPIEAVVVQPENAEPAATSSCKSGACSVPEGATLGVARVVDRGDSWLLQVPLQELRHPTALTTNLARSLAFIFLVESQRPGDVVEPPVDVTADFIAVALGLGTLMLQGSYLYAKSCGGPQIASVTKVPVGELAILVALFAALGGHDLGPAKKLLDVTQRYHLTEADALMRGNRDLLLRITHDPIKVGRGELKLSPPATALGGWLSKLFRRAPTPAGSDAAPDLEDLESFLINMPSSSTVSQRPSRKQPDRDELAALVGEELKARA